MFRGHRHALVTNFLYKYFLAMTLMSGDHVRQSVTLNKLSQYHRDAIFAYRSKRRLSTKVDVATLKQTGAYAIYLRTRWGIVRLINLSACHSRHFLQLVKFRPNQDVFCHDVFIGGFPNLACAHECPSATDRELWGSLREVCAGARSDRDTECRVSGGSRFLQHREAAPQLCAQFGFSAATASIHDEDFSRFVGAENLRLKLITDRLIDL